jgi:murein DD-endopeptidase MepM/ murein hydrolase activator NlpD
MNEDDDNPTADAAEAEAAAPETARSSSPGPVVVSAPVPPVRMPAPPATAADEPALPPAAPVLAPTPAASAAIFVPPPPAGLFDPPAAAPPEPDREKDTATSAVHAALAEPLPAVSSVPTGIIPEERDQLELADDPDASLTVDQVSEDPPEVVCPSPTSRGRTLVLTPVGSSPAVIEKRSLPRSPRKILLDPVLHDVPVVPPPRKKKPARTLPARSRALLVGGLGVAVVGGLFALLLRLDPNRGPLFAFPASAPTASAVASGGPSLWPPGALTPTPANTGLSGLTPLLADDGPPLVGAVAAPAGSLAMVAGSANANPGATEPAEPAIFRVKDLSADGVRIIEGKMGTRSLMDALTEEKVPQSEVFRILRSFEDAKRFDKPRKNDTFVVAFDRANKKVKGFEYQSSPVDIWQSRENEAGLLSGSKLDLHVDTRRVAKAVLVKDDLRTAIVEAGFDDDILDTLDDALESRIALSRIHRGATLRIVAQEERMLGKFTRYVDVEAVEYTDPKGDVTRIYHLKNGQNPGYFDAKAKASARGGWRYPVKLPRITSRYNPKRMHPVLHVVRPHNGCDFGAPTGTPIYAASKGTVEIAGPHGPSGNLVTINHGGGIVTGYAHMSRFAPGIKPGDKVDGRQLIGYVGTTGRSTGPHLHFSLKRNGVFADPLSLKMDGERGLAPEDRGLFETLKQEMNALLDAIPLPEKPKDLGSEDNKPDETDDDHHDGEGDGDKPSQPSTPPTPGQPASAEAPAAPPPKPPEEGSLDSAVWKP